MPQPLHLMRAPSLARSPSLEPERRRLRAWNLVAIACFASLTACPKGGGGNGNGGGKVGRQAPTVEVVKVERKETPSLVTMPIVLEGRKQVEVYSRVAGRVKAISRQVGAKVGAGSQLFLVDRSEPGDTFLAVPILSPIAGTVAQWYVSAGDQIAAADRAVLVVDDGALRAKLYLAVPDWQGVTQKTAVTIEAGGEKRAAKIVSVARAVQATSGKALVEVEIANPKSDWRAGVGATAVVSVAPTPRMVVSSRALLLTSDGAFLYTVDNGQAKRRKVTFLPRGPDEVELTGEALPDGSLVVVTGASRLSDGAKVTVAGASKP